MENRKLNKKYIGGEKEIVENFEIRGNNPYDANQANSKLALFIHKVNQEAEDISLHLLNAHLYNVDANEDLGTIVALVDHRDEGLVEIDTDVAPFFVKTL